MTVSTFALGALAQPVFGLGFVDAALTVVCINVLGILPVSFFSTFGPRFGLRQMVLSRFFFGFYVLKLSESYHPSFPHHRRSSFPFDTLMPQPLSPGHRHC